MPLSYAGVQLDEQEGAVAARLERHFAEIGQADLFDFTRADWPGKNRSTWTYSGTTNLPSVRPGVLRWPRGAAQFAVGYFYCTTFQLNAIRQVLTTQGYSAQPLVITHDGTTPHTISPALWMLPARPLAAIAGCNGLHLLTLVDDRYWWSFRDSGEAVVTPYVTTWAQLYADCASALGVGISNDSIPAAYLQPAQRLTGRYESTPLLLDAIAYNVGQRIARGLDGAVYAYGATTSQGIVSANLGKGWPVMGGGSFAFTPGVPNDLAAVLPGSVRVTFPQFTGGSPTGDVYTQTVTLASLALSDIGTSGNPNTKTFHDECVANGTGTPANNSELLALAQQVATDWYRHQAGPVDLKLSGILPWQPEGLSEAIEWTYRKNEVSTRILRPAWNDLAEELLHSSQTSIPNRSWGGGPMPGFWARITGQSGTSNVYSFTQVEDDNPPNAWTNTTVPPVGFPDLPGGISGSANAEEVNNNTGVPADATTGIIVWMWPNVNKAGWYEFSYPSSGFWARITAQSGTTDVYSWVQVYDPSPPNSWANLPGGLSGSANAEESNGNQYVPANATTGAVVWMRPNTSKPGWYAFEYTGLTVADINPNTITVQPTFKLQFDNDNGPVWSLTNPALDETRVKLNGYTGTQTIVTAVSCGAAGLAITTMTFKWVDGILMSVT